MEQEQSILIFQKHLKIKSIVSKLNKKLEKLILNINPVQVILIMENVGFIH